MKLTNLKLTDRAVYGMTDADNKTSSAYDVMRHYLKVHEKFPFVTTYMNTNNDRALSLDLLLARFAAAGAEVLTCANTYGMKDEQNVISSMVLLLDGVFFYVTGVYYKTAKDFAIKDIEGMERIKGKLLRMVQALVVYHPTLHLSDETTALLDAALLPVEKRTGNISIISRDQSGFYLNETPIEHVTNTDELDLYYGEGFATFHETLVERLATSNKGLTLLHGEPGTGKSTYIRKMIVDIQKLTTKKIVIVPNHMIDCLADPEFNTFLLFTSQEAEDEDYEVGMTDEAEAEKGVILVLEDAESVLQHRSGHNSGTASLLNLTSGLLNDIFGVQIIATYNTEDKNIDPAVKRSQRLIADHYFAKLTLEESKALGTHIGINADEVTKEMTVADLYSLKDKDKENILIAPKKKQEKAKIGFKK